MTPGSRSWAQLLAGRYVSVVLDCDPAGRDAVGRIVGDLKAAGVGGTVIDLARQREDGYDLTDWLSARADRTVAELRRALGAPDARSRAQPPRTAKG